MDAIVPPSGGAFWRWLLPAFVGATLLLLIVNFAEWCGIGGAPSFGYWDAVTVPSGTPFVAQIMQPIEGGAAARAGLRDGDRIDVRDIGAYDRVALLFQPVTWKPPVLVVQRGGTTSTIRVVPTTFSESSASWKISNTIVDYVAALALVACALLLALRRSSSSEARYLCLAMLAFVSSTDVSPTSLVQPNGSLGALLWFLSGTFACAAALLPVAMSRAFGKPSLLRTVVEGMAVALGVLALTGAALGAVGLLNASIDPISYIYGNWRVAYGAIFVGSIAAASMAVASTPQTERARASWLLLPLPLSMLLYTVFSQLSTSTPSWAAYMTLWILAFASLFAGAMAVTYALLKRRVLDVQFVISRTLVVGGVSAIVIVSFVLLEWLLGTVLADVSHATGLAANAALALLLGLSMSFIHKRVDAFVDFAFFHKRHEDEHALRDFGKEAAFVTRRDDLLDRAIEVLRDHTDAAAAALVLDGDGTYRAIRWFGDAPREASENDALILALKSKHAPIDPHKYATALAGDVAIPMSARGHLLGVLLCGKRASGEAYAPDEVDALAQFAHGIGSALESIDRTQGSNDRSDAMLQEIRALREIAELGAKNSEALIALLSKDGRPNETA